MNEPAPKQPLHIRLTKLSLALAFVFFAYLLSAGPVAVCFERGWLTTEMAWPVEYAYAPAFRTLEACGMERAYQNFLEWARNR